MNYQSGSHNKYYLKYHVIWCTKYRYRILSGNIQVRCREVIRQIAESIEVKIETGSISADHIHLMLEIPASISVSKVIQRLKGASSHKLMGEYPELRRRYWGQHMWARGYFVSTIGNVNEEMINEYINNQEKEPENPINLIL